MSGKYLFTFCLFLFINLASCSKSDDCVEIQFDQLFQFQEGDLFCIGTELEIEISKIDDQRCPCDVVCVWEGEFVYEIKIKSLENEEEYLLHEKLENDPTVNDGLIFSDITMISDDSCENMIDIDKIIFQMKVNQ